MLVQAKKPFSDLIHLPFVFHREVAMSVDLE